jgi:methionyl-tRNA formyltransferase
LDSRGQPNKRYTVASIKPWNLEAFEHRRVRLPGEWRLITGENELNFDILSRFGPRYVFLPHWSWRVPDRIIEGFECICFHMTDLPYGRGGSPLQNLIIRGHKETMVTALRMAHDLDAGPIYLKKPLSLAGSAQQIFERAAEVVFDMIEQIIQTEPQPEPQIGTPVIFKRRTPAESELPQSGSPEQIYDFIRMLDADSYPSAFVDWGELRLSFSDAVLENGELVAKVTILPQSEKQNG